MSLDHLVPQFDVHLRVPDLSQWRDGNTGVPGFTTIDSGRDGPHVGLVALVHGNEIAGAIVLERMLCAGVRPVCGRISFGFANLAAFARFDPGAPTNSRFVDEDMNRIWDPAVLDGPRRSAELDRAREMRPIIATFDVLLDLHSMLWPSDPLILSGPSPKGRSLAARIGTPGLIVSDHGHVSGPRLIDAEPFTNPERSNAAVLVEAGQHWEKATVVQTQDCVDALLATTGLLPARVQAAPLRCAEVTMAVTAATAGFAFVQSYRGGDVVPARNTLIALDGGAEIRTPHDDCLLIMPSLRPSRGHTAVRLARFIEPCGPDEAEPCR